MKAKVFLLDPSDGRAIQDVLRDLCRRGEPDHVGSRIRLHPRARVEFYGPDEVWYVADADDVMEQRFRGLQFDEVVISARLQRQVDAANILRRQVKP